MLELCDQSILATQALIGGRWSSTAATMEVIDPANGSIVAKVADCSREDAAAAIAAARDAQGAWAGAAAKERASVLRRWHDLIVAAADDLAALTTAEMGKPIDQARAEALYAAGYVEWFAEEAKRVYGSVVPGHARDKRIIVIRQPIGVAAAITPWNFPLAMPARKLAPALAAGCAVVLKPSPETPLTALALAVLAERAGVPAGILSVLPSTDAVGLGLEFCSNPIVRKITFTGSTEVERILMRQGSDQIKRLSLELGGNAPLIVFDDADLDAAVQGAVEAKFRNGGQACISANRIYAQAGIHDAFADRLAARAVGLRVGAGTEPGVEVGPLVSPRACRKALSHVEDVVAHGGRVLTGGRVSALGGSFVEPTVLAGVTASMRIAHEETFGPVAPILRFDTEDEVVAAANASELGLAAYVFTRAWRMMERLECGMVGINTGLISTPALSRPKSRPSAAGSSRASAVRVRLMVSTPLSR
jgi:succinate-semialdehyde dehydrogenase/glutarate-semialdehyde dehydrogenase